MTPFEIAMKKVEPFVGPICAMDNAKAGIGMLSDEVWDVQVFNWFESGFESEFADEFGDYFLDVGWIDDDYNWVKEDLIPFAFVGPADTDGRQYPTQICGCILFFDLAAGTEETCPIKVGWPDDFELETHFERIEDLELREKA
jgi:hypothetical protein